VSDSLDRLIQEFYDTFIALYHKTAGPSGGGAFLAFEPIGTALTPDMFDLPPGGFSPLLAAERFSTLANTLPELDGTTITGPSIRSADGLYEMLMIGAQPLPSSDRSGFDRFKSEALELFDRAKAHPLLHDGREYRTAVATPPDWCAPATTWVKRTFSTEERTQSETGPVKMAQSKNLVVERWAWRVAPPDVALALDNPGAVHQMVSAKAVTIAGLKQPQRMMMSSATPIFKASPALMASAAVRPLTFGTKTFVQRPLATFIPPPNTQAKLAVTRPELQAAAAQQLSNEAKPQEVTSKSLSLSFDYCLVTVTRPWLSTPLLAMKSWFIDGHKAGELASGEGTGTGAFEVIPMAALAVKNLEIKAAWSTEERAAAAGFMKLGPFSLLGRTSSGAELNAISCPGMQIIAWICQAMPLLPPAADPALAAAPPDVVTG
jgi:hypothetical protein